MSSHSPSNRARSAQSAQCLAHSDSSSRGPKTSAVIVLPGRHESPPDPAACPQTGPAAYTRNRKSSFRQNSSSAPVPLLGTSPSSRPFRWSSTARLSPQPRPASNSRPARGALLRENASSCPFLCHRSAPPTPTGNFGSAASVSVAVSSTCKTLVPSSLVTSAIFFPSLVRSNVSTSHAIVVVKYLS